MALKTEPYAAILGGFMLARSRSNSAFQISFSRQQESPDTIARSNRTRWLKRLSLGMCSLLAVALLSFADSARAQNITLARAISTVAGNGTTGYGGDGGPATSAQLQKPWGVAVDAAGNFYIADQFNNRVRKVDTSGNITTFAGTGTAGFSGDSGPATSAELNTPYNVATDSAGNVYIADYFNYRVRKVDTSGNITTVAGNGTYGFSGDGSAATSASISDPIGLAIDPAGNIYIGDYFNNRVRVVNVQASPITIAGVIIPGGAIMTVAGNGTAGYTGDTNGATVAEINGPNGVALDSAGNIYIADYHNNVIRKVTTVGVISTFAGNGTAGYSGDSGPATSAELNLPWTVVVDSAGDVYIGDEGNVRVRKVDTSGNITTVAGNGTLGYTGDGGPAVSAEFDYPSGVALDGAGNLYVGDLENSVIRKVTPGGQAPVYFGRVNVNTTGAAQPVVFSINANFTVNTVPTTSGDFTITNPTACHGPLTAGSYCTLNIQFKPAAPGQRWFPLTLTDSTGKNYSFGLEGIGVGSALAFTPGIITTFAGNGFGSGGDCESFCGGFSGDGGPATSAELNGPNGVAVDSTGNLYIADYGNDAIRKVNTLGIITTVAGIGGSSGYSGDNGPATSAKLFNPTGVAEDSAGNLYIADIYNQVVRKVDANGIITTIAGINGPAAFSGDGGPATSAQLSYPNDVALDSAGNLYISDEFNQRIRKVDLNGIINTIAGNGTSGFAGDNGPATSAELDGPSGIAVDSTGNLYIADSANYRIRKVDVHGTITTLAGNGTPGFSGNGVAGTSAELLYPQGVAADGAGDVYIADLDNEVVRKVDVNGIITTVAGMPDVAGYSGDGATATGATLNYVPGVAVDNAGDIYISDAGNYVIREVIALSSALYFGYEGLDMTSPTQTVAASNVGTAALNFSSIGVSTTNFLVESVANQCSMSTPLVVGYTCELGVAFDPMVAGNPLTDTLTVSDDAFNSSQLVSLVGGEVQLTITVNGVGSDSVDYNDYVCYPNNAGYCSNTFDAGNTVTLNAEPQEGSTFVNWGGACASAGVNTACTLTMTGNLNVTANFNPSATTTYLLTVTELGTGTGSVSDGTVNLMCSEMGGTVTGPCTNSYSAASSVTLTATAGGSPASTFAGWGGACATIGSVSPSGGSCTLTNISSPLNVTADFVPPPTSVTLSFTTSTIPETQQATFDCTITNPTPTNPCTDTYGQGVSLGVQSVSMGFSARVTRTEIPPSMFDGICEKNGGTVNDGSAAVAADFDCRFLQFFNYGTDPVTGGAIVPFCYPYAHGNCVHYAVDNGTAGMEPNPGSYLGPVNWVITWNFDTLVAPLPYWTGSTPQLYDDPDSPPTPLSAFGTSCTSPMLIGSTPQTYYCQFEFDITTFYNPIEPVDSGIGGSTKAFNDVVVAWPPTNAPGNATLPLLNANSTPDSPSVTYGTGIGFTITLKNNGTTLASGITLNDPLPGGAAVNWVIASSSIAGCTISGTNPNQTLSCPAFMLAMGATDTIHVTSSDAATGVYTNVATFTIGTQQTLGVATVVVNGATSTLKFSPTALNFGTVDTGGTVLLALNITNTGASMVTFTNFSVGSIPTDDSSGYFGVEFCPHTLNPGKSCIIIMSFTADSSVTKTHAANLVIADSAPGSPQLILMSATVINPVASLSPSSINFGSVSSSGGTSTKSVTLKNSGTTPLILSGLSVSGTGFTLATGTNACTATTTLNSGATCTIYVTFKPTSRGSKSGSVKITDNALSIQQFISLSGNGT